VKSALIAEKDLKARDIKVDTRSGRVQLNGTVPSPADAQRAEQLARNVEGVQGIDNRLMVSR
jgi:osmotically-inducible protein OsmY